MQNNICLRPKSCNAMSIIVHNKWNIILRNMTFAKPIICASLFSKNKRISGYTTNVICQIIYNEVTLNHNWNTHNSMQVFWEIAQYTVKVLYASLSILLYGDILYKWLFMTSQKCCSYTCFCNFKTLPEMTLEACQNNKSGFF